MAKTEPDLNTPESAPSAAEVHEPQPIDLPGGMTVDSAVLAASSAQADTQAPPVIPSTEAIAPTTAPKPEADPKTQPVPTGKFVPSRRAVEDIPALKTTVTEVPVIAPAEVGADEPTTHSRRRLLGWLLGGAAVVVGGGTAIKILAAGNSNTKEGSGPSVKAQTAPEPTSVPETSVPATTVPPTAAPEVTSGSEIPTQIQLQVSDDPTELGNQIYKNKQFQANNPTEANMSYTYSETANGQEARDNVLARSISNKKINDSRPGSYTVLKATPQGNPEFSPDDEYRTVTYVVTEYWEDSTGNDIQPPKVYTETLTLTPIKNTRDLGNGPELVTEWLIDTQYSPAS